MSHCLEEIDLANAVFENINVGNSMFTNCSALDEIILLDGMQAVGSSMFQYCYHKGTGKPGYQVTVRQGQMAHQHGEIDPYQ